MKKNVRILAERFYMIGRNFLLYKKIIRSSAISDKGPNDQINSAVPPWLALQCMQERSLYAPLTPETTLQFTAGLQGRFSFQGHDGLAPDSHLSVM